MQGPGSLAKRLKSQELLPKEASERSLKLVRAGYSVCNTLCMFSGSYVEPVRTSEFDHYLNHVA